MSKMQQCKCLKQNIQVNRLQPLIMCFRSKIILYCWHNDFDLPNMLLTNVVYYIAQKQYWYLYCSDEWSPDNLNFMGTGMNHLNTGNHLHTSWKHRPILWAARTDQISGFQGTVLDNWQCLRCIHDQTRTLQCGISPCTWLKQFINLCSVFAVKLDQAWLCNDFKENQQIIWCKKRRQQSW
jgi:hypothetical protein